MILSLPAPIIATHEHNGVIVQTMGISGTEFFSVDGKKFYISYDGAYSQKPNTVLLQNNVFAAFHRLADKCEFAGKNFFAYECNHAQTLKKHPMGGICTLKNCPLLS